MRRIRLEEEKRTQRQNINLVKSMGRQACAAITERRTCNEQVKFKVRQIRDNAKVRRKSINVEKLSKLASVVLQSSKMSRVVGMMFKLKAFSSRVCSFGIFLGKNAVLSKIDESKQVAVSGEDTHGYSRPGYSSVESCRFDAYVMTVHFTTGVRTLPHFASLHFSFTQYTRRWLMSMGDFLIGNLHYRVRI